MIGDSQAFKNLLSQAEKMAASHARILLSGETGTGKECIARYIHAHSFNAHGPFVAINCSALPAALLESELFGHVKGAFTGALRNYEGLIASAEGGTLFLDEIADLELPLQAKLLRFLETGEYRRVGSTTLEFTKVRIISATHRDLKELVRQGLFREDLYYRLSVLGLHLPALRQRRDDIPLLATHFLQKYAADENRSVTAIAAGALLLLEQQAWAGNIRELQNIIHQAVILCQTTVLDVDVLQKLLPITALAENVVSLHRPHQSEKIKPLWQVEAETIADAIEYCAGNIPRAAALLQVSPSTLYRRQNNPDLSGR